ncbi:MAG: hypothetical protein QOH42_353 [Blastocatellia bacterium]|nr:hypothetical protein [Blastocatellia bacterium]
MIFERCDPRTHTKQPEFKPWLRARMMRISGSHFFSSELELLRIDVGGESQECNESNKPSSRVRR